MTKSDILHFFNEKKSFLKEQYHVDDIGLFCSYSRDEATQNSDIDIVISTSVKSFTNRYNLKKYLVDAFKKPVDIITMIHFAHLSKKRLSISKRVLELFVIDLLIAMDKISRYHKGFSDAQSFYHNEII